MEAEKIDNRQEELFRSRLSVQIDPGHELVKLAQLVQWGYLEKEYGKMYVNGSRGGNRRNQLD